MPTLPPLLLTSEPESFARKTFQTRIPRIIDEVIAVNAYPAEMVAALRALRAEIVNGTLQLLREDAEDREFWNAQARAYLGRTWLDLPWYWAEAFFYRRLLEATRYFQDGDFYRRDPYAPIKRAELQPDRAPRAVNAILEHLPIENEHAFHALVRASLWGNRADLSMRGIITDDATNTSLLVDDRARVWEFLRRARGRVDVLCDNAGVELGFDVALVDFLLRTDLATEIVMHVKPQPTFVSDATLQDVRETLDVFGKADAPALRHLAQRLARALNDGRVVLSDHPFWVSGFFFHDLPSDLRAMLARATLVVCKGDANYRRLVGDCHWEPTTPFQKVAAHFPAPVVALRTLKSEVIVGLAAGEAERQRAQDPAWWVNGTRGVIQFAPVQGE
ncbi:MAG: damage-control phosphatase ARMT1 family protein [Anaerolineae bacterium]|nr:damage-control phosphatase ARMT1 family protein [Anaerolineae bacterium]